jgi:hypothetical protein
VAWSAVENKYEKNEKGVLCGAKAIEVHCEYGTFAHGLM